MLRQALSDFLMLLVTIDPIGTVALFVPLTVGMSVMQRRAVARKAVLVSTVVLLGFLMVGEVLLAHLGIRLQSFQVAGGVILFLFGLQMVFGIGVLEEKVVAEPGRDIAVFPLALPAIANPGAITAVVLLTDNHRHSMTEQIITALILLFVLALTIACLYTADAIHRVLGDTGANVLIRVLGLVLAALATEQIVTGVETLLKQGAS
jgi:multiple antibiotic resistance protein